MESPSSERSSRNVGVGFLFGLSLIVVTLTVGAVTLFVFPKAMQGVVNRAVPLSVPMLYLVQVGTFVHSYWYLCLTLPLVAGFVLMLSGGGKSGRD